MFTEERFAEILKIVQSEKSVTVQELTKMLDTSESTIRRDLTALHKRKLLVKVHGGATVIGMDYMTKDASVVARQDLNRQEKQMIGKYAASLIEKEDFVYVDAGTSTEHMIDYIANTEAVYVTNGILHAQKLLRAGCQVLLPGGDLKPVTEAIVGAEAVKSLEKYNFTKGFFGTNGLDAVHGFTTPDAGEALIKETAMKKCKKAYILADSSKFGQISPVKFAEFASAQIITTVLKHKEFKPYQNITEVKTL